MSESTLAVTISGARRRARVKMVAKNARRELTKCDEIRAEKSVALPGVGRREAGGEPFGLP